MRVQDPPSLLNPQRHRQLDEHHHVLTQPVANDRPRAQPRWRSTAPPAHIHFHAESAELAWLYGKTGQQMVSMSEVHFPLGGRRFRPTVEDILRFLDHEKMFRGWASGWRQAVDQSLKDWNDQQARATVRRFPDAAVDQLAAMGYTITPPLEP